MGMQLDLSSVNNTVAVLATDDAPGEVFRFAVYGPFQECEAASRAAATFSSVDVAKCAIVSVLTVSEVMRKRGATKS